MQAKLLSLGLSAVVVGAMAMVAPQQAQAQTYFDYYGNPYYGNWRYSGSDYTSIRPYRDRRGFNWRGLVNRVVNRLVDDRYGYGGFYPYSHRYPYSYPYGVRVGGSYWTY